MPRTRTKTIAIPDPADPVPQVKTKRPLNSYQQFFKKLYYTPECQAKSVRDRVSWIASEWRKHKDAQ